MTAAPAIGHNSRNDLIDATLESLREIEQFAPEWLHERHADLMRRLAEIERVVEKGLPDRLESLAEAEKLSDVQFALKKWISAAKAARTEAKRPWDSVGKVFYAFFTRPIDSLETVAERRIAPVLAEWQEREADRLRREAAELARQAREQAERAAREAREAEARRIEAERQQREAREAAERLERERQAAQAAFEAARRQRLDEEARAKEAQRRAAADEAAAAEARQRAEEARKAERIARDAAHQAAADRREQERLALAAQKAERAESGAQIAAQQFAARAEKNIIKAEATLAKKPAELARVRGEAGSVSTLRTYWTFDQLERADLDLEALRQHLPADALATAVRGFIAAGGRSLAGVRIYETTETLTR